MTLLTMSILYFIQRTRFGKLPSGERLERIKKSPNYKRGQFQNRIATPTLTDGVNVFKAIWQLLFEKSKQSKPHNVMITNKTDLLNLNPDKNILVWFGHSSYFMQIDGKKILVDPVLSGSASPFSFTTKSYHGSDVYTPDDFPEIDYLFISHDHWDHLDYETVTKLMPKIKKVITGLGTGAHFESWGFNSAKIVEKDWNEEVVLDNEFTVYITPARHYAGRGLRRNKALWVSFVLQTPSLKLYLGGDSGYDTHFKEIGDKYGPFDLALLECGQYNPNWKYIHMSPEETVQAGIDLKAKNIMPVHWAKFSMSSHAWDEPIKRASIEALRKNIPLVHPMIGEQVNLNNPLPASRWWHIMD